MSTEPVRTIEPATLAQGEKVDFTRSFCGYPATEWTVAYRFRGPGTGFDVDASADGDDFDISLAIAAALTVGKWQWQAWATNIADSTVTRKIDEGVVTIEKGFASGTTAAVETRSGAKIMLDAIDAALSASASSDLVEYEITTPAGGRRIKRATRADAIAQRRYWAGVVARENAAERVRNGGKFAKAVKVNFYER